MKLGRARVSWVLAVTAGLLLGAGTQHGHGQTMSVGPRFGLGLSTVRFQDPNANNQTEMKTGFVLGGSAVLPRGKYLEVEGSLLLVQSGFAGRGGHPASLNTTHVEVPLLVRLRGPWRVSPHLTGGVAARLQLGCHLSEVGRVGEAGCDDPVVGRGWRRFDLAMVGGVGSSFPVKGGVFLVEGLVVWGLKDLRKSPLPPGWAKSAALRLSTGLRFPLR